MSSRPFRGVVALVLVGLLSSCGERAAEQPLGQSAPAAPRNEPADAFLAAMAASCGRSYTGRLIKPDASELSGKTMTLKMAPCAANAQDAVLRVYVEDKPSISWTLTRTAEGMRLRHRSMMPDGEIVPLAGYGGVTANPGTATTQAFQIDKDSIAYLANLDQSNAPDTIWTLTLEPGDQFLYRREGGGGAKTMEVRFDLSRPGASAPEKKGG